MTSLSYIRRLFRYDDWANREILNALQKPELSSERSLKLLAHIGSAERLWLERLRSLKQTHPVWPDFSLQNCKSEVEELAKLWQTYLGSMKESELAHSVTYRNSQGEAWTSQTQDIMMHVILHSAYHRGQIAAQMRAAGFAPAHTDFIHAVRQGFIEQG
ncbi:MAG TPA: DinB family protein [Terriglobales bacterium]|nr:DinB family protein [Terriglobales bacterium]